MARAVCFYNSRSLWTRWRRPCESAVIIGATRILDPAPARALPKEILELVDIATPNETEACVLAGVPPSRVSPSDAVALGNKIRELGIRSVVVKFGDQGSVTAAPTEHSSRQHSQ